MNQTPDTYNGWTNRETWAVFVHLTNSRWLMERAAEALKDQPALDPDWVLKDHVEGWWYTIKRGKGEHHELYSMALEDIGSLWRVDWKAVAAAFKP